MTKKDIDYIARTLSQADVLRFLISRVNLRDDEKGIAETRIVRGLTQERAAEELNRSKEWIQKREDEVYRKIA